MVGKLTKLIIQSSSPKIVKTYCVSLSLGTHLCGFAGKVIRFTGIIALDPTGPIFETSSENGRLSRNDAEAVYVFHTNYKFAGIKRPIGDVDFYVNGGALQAVQCNRTCLDRSGFGTCHHMWSTDIFFHMQNQYCATNVYCPVHDPSSIDGIKFPEINVLNGVVKDWVPISERSGISKHGQVYFVNLISNAINRHNMIFYFIIHNC